MEFVAIDFETANESLDSICQIGVASFDNGRLVSCWQTLVNPEDYFSGMNVYIHGISESDVRNAPKFPEAFAQLSSLVQEQVVVHHTCFDKAALSRAVPKHGLGDVKCEWLDSARVVRRTWPECEQCGYGLAPVAAMLGIEFKHHSAVEDARAAGEIFLRALATTGLTIAEWIVRAALPIHLSPNGSARCVRDGDRDGLLFGETVVFTGSLSVLRSKAADAAAAAGCNVADSVTKATTILVVGDEDVRKLAGHEKSKKHRAAEAQITKGHQIRIITEGEFFRVIADADQKLTSSSTS